MFAILISEENLPKIHEHQATLFKDVNIIYESVYINAAVDYYYVQGLIDQKGNLSWGAYPEEFFLRNFDCVDINKAKTDWTIVVQK